MAIHPKPFEISDAYKRSLSRSIFAGRPSIFSAEDLNRQLSAMIYFNELISAGHGLMKENWTASFTIGSVYPCTSSFCYDVTMSFVTDGVNYSYVHAKGVSIELPLEAFTITKTLSFLDENLQGIYLYLIAEKHTVTFAEDNEMSGIHSTEHTTPIASSDTIMYQNARLVLTNPKGYAADVILDTEEEVIGILWSCTKKTTYAADLGATQSWLIQYHATDYIAEIDALPYIADLPEVDPFDYQYNMSFYDLFMAYRRATEQRIDYLEKAVALMQNPA